MKAIEINGNIKTFRRLPNVWEDENGLHLNFREGRRPNRVWLLRCCYTAI